MGNRIIINRDRILDFFHKQVTQASTEDDPHLRLGDAPLANELSSLMYML